MSLTQPIQVLFAKLDAWREDALKHAPIETTFEVDATVSGAAKFYEKVRYLVDYREEHTIRRSAIERILRRRTLIESQPIFGDDLLRELAEGQYIAKEHVTEEASARISTIVARYQSLSAELRARGRIDKRLLSFAATEIEHSFDAEMYAIDAAVSEALYATVRPHVQVHGATEREIDIQLFCATRRTLLSLDNETLSYYLWLAYVPSWNGPAIDTTQLVSDLPKIISSIEYDLKNPLQWQLQAKIKNESICFNVLRELLRKKKGAAEWVLQNQKELDAFARTFLEEKYEHENKKLQSSGIRAVGYLFFTKMLAALFLELPYELLILGRIHYVPLLTNTLFHPLLLLTFTRGIGSLDEKNTESIVAGMHDVFYNGKVRAIRIQPQHTALSAIFGLVYFFLICALFLGIVGVLTFLNFNFASMVLFVFFLALVSYFAFRIRSNAQRWKVSEPKGSFSLILHVLALPIVRTGRWLSQTFSSINLIVLFMDFIIETPFKLLLNFSSKFFVYLREKADDVY